MHSYTCTRNIRKHKCIHTYIHTCIVHTNFSGEACLHTYIPKDIRAHTVSNLNIYT